MLYYATSLALWHSANTIHVLREQICKNTDYNEIKKSWLIISSVQVIKYVNSYKSQAIKNQSCLDPKSWNVL